MTARKVSAGVRAGAITPYQTLPTTPGTLSPKVCTSGNLGSRAALAMASTFSRPARTCGMHAGIELMTMGTCPPTASAKASAPPL